MKKVLLVAFGIFFYSLSINAQDIEIININQEIEFQMCPNPNIESDNLFCYSEKRSFISLNELINKNIILWNNGRIRSSYYNCYSLPLFPWDKFRGESVRAEPFLQEINHEYSDQCDVIVKEKYVQKLGECLNKYGKKRRQKCVDENKIVVLKPVKKFIFKKCENEILGIRTNLITLDNTQQCSSLNKFNPSWKKTTYWTKVNEEDLFSEHKYEFVFFLDYLNDPSNQVVKKPKNNNVDEQKILEEKRIAEEKRLKELEEKRIAEEKRLKELEEKRKAEEKRLAEQKKKEEEKEKLYSVSSGTGFFITDNGYVVTNNHVTNFCNTNDIHYNGLVYETILIANDPINDLSLLKANLKTNYKFYFAKDDIGLLEDIYIAGFPFGYDLSTSVKVTQGIVSALSGLENNFSRFQVDAALQKGNSGGPIIDMNGNVVGVAVEKANYKYILENYDAIPENLNFGIKLSTLQTFLKSNGIKIDKKNDNNLTKSEVGKLITNATVYVDCLMTEARYNEVESKNQKVLFKKIK